MDKIESGGSSWRRWTTALTACLALSVAGGLVAARGADARASSAGRVAAPAQESLASSATVSTPDAAALVGLRRISLVVADADAALRFYRDLLGLRVRHDAPLASPRLRASVKLSAEASVRFVQLEAVTAGQPLLGLLEIRAAPKSQADAARAVPAAILVWQVRDLDRLVARAREMGFEVASAPEALSGTTGVTGREATVLDPNGVRVILQELR